MKNLQKLTLLLACISLNFTLLPGQALNWTTAGVPWPESFGSQRAIVEIGKPATSVEIDLLWRRHDHNPEERRFLLIEASSGDTIKNISRLEVNTEHCTSGSDRLPNPASTISIFCRLMLLKAVDIMARII